MNRSLVTDYLAIFLCFIGLSRPIFHVVNPGTQSAWGGLFSPLLVSHWPQGDRDANVSYSIEFKDGSVSSFDLWEGPNKQAYRYPAFIYFQSSFQMVRGPKRGTGDLVQAELKWRGPAQRVFCFLDLASAVGNSSGIAKVYLQTSPFEPRGRTVLSCIQ